MTKVKICGLQEPEHVRAAVAAGADAIGFVFAPSKRQISIDQAKELAHFVPEGVLKIGVFVNPTYEELEETVHTVPLDYVQFHGHETPDYIATCHFPSIKALAVKSIGDVESGSKFNTDYLLFDAPGTDFQGGSGIPFDWQLLQGHGILENRLILAGGLNPTNVGEAIIRVKPYMVDVSSGVEKNGRKSNELIKAFIQAVKDEERL
ncbi:phosphoribosylanthranilate isomerase [Viridibacillus sp. YIM B01967]|uniref:N-(5'-phosphoribosyl)anthranilate isomerase n=1 Tax=Viridibacillus soli TaxID=2798301 RepID=A0ABS1H2Q5_9BACL|nr:phosphoribosylanthranilate isomerase [Viridibacillus soli]MBK3493685.1 phosphoribosylanthranilate isomerase [Viridibacillus soli]